jgi:hypothetical protein
VGSRTLKRVAKVVARRRSQSNVAIAASRAIKTTVARKSTLKRDPLGQHLRGKVKRERRRTTQKAVRKTPHYR